MTIIYNLENKYKPSDCLHYMLEHIYYKYEDGADVRMLNLYNSVGHNYSTDLYYKIIKK